MERQARVVLTTAPDLDTARRLGRDLVARRLAACVQLVPGALSIYSWEGRVQEESEVLLILKTAGECVPELETYLAEEHPYDTPECIALASERVAERYSAWLMDWVSSDAGAEGGSPQA